MSDQPPLTNIEAEANKEDAAPITSAGKMIADEEVAKQDFVLETSASSCKETPNAREEIKDACPPEGKLTKAKIDEDGFVSPLNLPPVVKTVKKEDSSKKHSPVSMAFRSRFVVPADIYKAPKIAAFVIDQPKKLKADKEKELSSSEEKSDEGKRILKEKPPPAKLTYGPPTWSKQSEENKYSLEVLKMGSIVGKVDLSHKEYFLVGRLSDCDIKMEHPSISRYHAVLQYGAPQSECENVELQKDGSSGFYLQDLGSTHGTFINKSLVSPKTFYRIKVGHVMKFGGSTRLYILQGPSADEEEEAKETATELRNLNRQRLKKKKDLERMMLGEDSSSDEEDGEKRKRRSDVGNSEGISWGMLEDAVQSSSDEEENEEEGGDPLALHPDAIAVHVKKDAFYVKDPMKALKNLYEKEKLDLEFECTEKRSGHWHVRLELPVDTPTGKPLYAEATATGKKKDTTKQCALEACRILERHGMFHHTDRHKQKLKQWEKDDFYDSDEDEFTDRTGEIEKKRNRRMQRVGKSSKIPKAVETYESLSKKVKDLEAELKVIEEKLHKDKQATTVKAGAVDPLDAFMQQVKSGKALDTTTRAKLKRRFFEAKKELMQISKLADLARPSTLPPLNSSYTKTYSFIGKMKGKRKPIVTSQPIQPPEVTKKSPQHNEVVEEEEEEEEEECEATNVSTPERNNPPQSSSSVVESNIKELSLKATEASKLTETPKESAPPPSLIEQTKGRTDISVVEKQKESESKHTAKKSAPNENSSKKRTLGPTLPLELKLQLINEQENNEEPGNDDEEAPEPRRKKKRVRKPKFKSSKANQQFSDDPDYCGWLPPDDQSGDGKTSLNEKLGY